MAVAELQISVPLQENHSGPLPNDIGASRTCYWWGLRTKAPLVRRRYRDAESLKSGRVWRGEPPQPTRGLGERCKLPQRGPGRSPQPKTGFDAFGASVLLRNFHWATLHFPSFPSFLPSSLSSPTFLFLPACPLPPTHSLAPSLSCHETAP